MEVIIRVPVGGRRLIQKHIHGFTQRSAYKNMYQSKRIDGKKNRMEYLSRSLQNVLVCAIDVRVGFVRENANDSSLFACSFTRDPRIA